MKAFMSPITSTLTVALDKALNEIVIINIYKSDQCDGGWRALPSLKGRRAPATVAAAAAAAAAAVISVAAAAAAAAVCSRW